MIYVFIDTNIYIRLLTNSTDNKLFDNLKILVNDGIIQLLVPEIILLELNKENLRSINEFDKQARSLNANITNNCKGIWSEIKDIEIKLNKLIDDEISIKKSSWKENYSELIKFLSSENIKFINFTPEIMCLGQKRVISGNMIGENSNRSSQDAYNIESLIQYLNSVNADTNSELLICTNDIKDFAKKTETKNGNTKKETFIIHDIFKKEFINPKGFSSLYAIMKHLDLGFEDINIDIDLDFEDIPSEEYIENFHASETYRVNKYKEHLDKKLSNSNSILRKYRDDLILSINKILSDCRNLKSFDDRSELKLYAVLEEIPEIELPISKLSTLIKIKNNLQDYKEVHEKMCL